MVPEQVQVQTWFCLLMSAYSWSCTFVQNKHSRHSGSCHRVTFLNVLVDPLVIRRCTATVQVSWTVRQQGVNRTEDLHCGNEAVISNVPGCNFEALAILSNFVVGAHQVCAIVERHGPGQICKPTVIRYAQLPHLSTAGR